MDSYEQSADFPLAFAIRESCQALEPEPLEMSWLRPSQARSMQAANLILDAAAQILEGQVETVIATDIERVRSRIVRRPIVLSSSELPRLGA